MVIMTYTSPKNLNASRQQTTNNLTKKQAKIPKKVTADRLRNIALYYLQRYASSSENLRQVLMRRVRKSTLNHADTDMEQASIWVDAIVADMQQLGYVNDAEYAYNRADSLHRRGTSQSHIRQKLKQKGLSDENIESALNKLLKSHGYHDEQSDLYGAIRYAKRRRIGVYRTHPTPDPYKQKQRDLASLARNGFSFDICKKVLDADNIEDLESLLITHHI